MWDAKPDIWMRKWIRVSDPVQKPDKPTAVKKESAPKTYKCTAPECGKVFLDQNALKKHMIVHGERVVNFSGLPKKQFVCPVEGCNKKF